MSINAAAHIALSSLLTTQVQMTVASANIANAGTQGYTEKTAKQASVVTGGAGAGVTITGISSTVDKLLLRSLMTATSDLGSADTKNTYLDQLQQLYGSTNGNDGSGTSLGNSLAALEAAVTALSATPDNASLQAGVVTALDAVAAQLRSTSSGIQALRSNADQQIASTVSDVNSQLQLIGTLNLQITQAAASGQPTGDLEDQRAQALQDIASKMDVSYFTNANGALQVYTTSGQALVDAAVHTISYTPAANVTAATAYSPTPPSGFSGIMVNGVDVTQQIKSGSIAALVNVRDTALPNAQAQLDQLATTLADSLNAVSNQGTALPPPSSLTGTAAVSLTTPLSSPGGTVRFAEVDSQGNLVSYQDLSLSGMATVGDLVTAINGIPGLSASLDSEGHLVVASTDSGDGVAINEMSGSIGGQGVSDFFGLNDLVTATGASDFAVRSGVLNNPALFPASTLDPSATLTTGSLVLPPASATMVNNLSSLLVGQTDFPAVGGLGTSRLSFANYAASIVSNIATQSATATSNFNAKQTAQQAFSSAMSSQSGVNIDEETARISTLQNQYAASAQLLQVLNQMFSTLLTTVQS